MRLYTLIGILFLTSCSMDKRDLSIEEFESYAQTNESGIVSRVTSGGFNFEIEYMPVEIIALRGADSKEDYLQQYPEILDAYNNLEYYTFCISSRYSNTRSQLIERFNGDESLHSSYLDLQIQNDIQLITGKDTIHCSYLHKEVSEGITNSLTYLLGFSRIDQTYTDRRIQLISQFSDIKNIDFLITEKSISSIPKIKIE